MPCSGVRSASLISMPRPAMPVVSERRSVPGIHVQDYRLDPLVRALQMLIATC